MSSEANRIVRKLWSYCTVVLFLKLVHEQAQPLWNQDSPVPAGYDWSTSASCNEMHTIAHPPEHLRYCYFSCETRPSVRPGPGPLSLPSAPLFGFNHHGHSESSTSGESFLFCPQT
jgi:hypothetical protein